VLHSLTSAVLLKVVLYWPPTEEACSSDDPMNNPRLATGCFGLPDLLVLSRRWFLGAFRTFFVCLVFFLRLSFAAILYLRFALYCVAESVMTQFTYLWPSFVLCPCTGKHVCSLTAPEKVQRSARCPELWKNSVRPDDHGRRPRRYTSLFIIVVWLLLC
jgi:hypothetical protein